MKILFFTDNFYPLIGGVQVATLRLAKKLVKEGNNVGIVCPSVSNANTISKKWGVTIYGVKSWLTPFHEFYRHTGYVNTLKVIRNILEMNRPDVIHIQTNGNIAKAAVELSKKFSIAVLASNHLMSENVKIYHTKISFLIEIFLKKYMWKEAKIIFTNADVITTPTDTAKSYFYDKLKLKKDVIVISNGIYTPNIKHKITTGKIKNILYVGRMDKEKNIPTLIKAVSEINKKIAINLILVGMGNETKKLKELVDNLNLAGNVTFTGFVSTKKLAEYYKMTDIFVMPSVAELQSISTLEAMAWGLPIIASNTGALPELVKNGVNGFLFEANNHNDLANCILKIVSQPKLKESMGNESLKIVKKHDINETVIKIQSLYQKAIAINLMKQREIKAVPFYLIRNFVVKVSLAVLVLGILFRNSLSSPSTAQAKNLAFKNKIMNLKIVKKIENLDLKFKTQVTRDPFKK